MDVRSFKYAKVIAVGLVSLFVVGMAISLIPALRFVGCIYIYRLLMYLSFVTFFVLLFIDSAKTSPLRAPAMVGVIGFFLMALYVFLYWTEISKGLFADWHERISYVASIIAFLWLCKFFRKGSRVKYAAIAVGAILLLTLIVDVTAIELLINAIKDYANKGKDMENALNTYTVLLQIGNYSKVSLALVSAWFMYEYSSIKK